MSVFTWLIIIYFILASIHTFDKDLEQSKKYDKQDFGSLPTWSIVFSIAMWSIQIWMLTIDWKDALTIFVIAFVLSVLPILGIVGNILCAPFKWSKKTPNNKIVKL